MAGDTGIGPDEVDRLRTGSAAEGWAPLDRALVAAAEELVADARIGDDTYATLATELDDRQLIDVVFTVGAYDLVAMAFRTFDVELDGDLRKWASLS